MMFPKQTIIFIIFASLLLNIDAKRGVNGGIPCAACTMAVGLAEQLGQVHNATVAQALGLLCSYFPTGDYEQACTDIVDFLGPITIDLIYMHATPDIICHSLNFCFTQPGLGTCHLFDFPKGGEKDRLLELGRYTVMKHMQKRHLKELPAICEIPGVKFFCKVFDRVFNEHVAAFDFDEDSYSTQETLRGSSWKGRDCNDLFYRFRPGAKPWFTDAEFDSNCNGIYGVDPKTGNSYEDELCKGTGQRGVAVIGDSASAHFHLPPEIIRPDIVNKDILAHVPYVIENEFDWPMMSSGTGYKNITWPIIQGPTRSLYTKLRDRNRCNHRDFQNIAVNGADIFKTQNYQKALARDPLEDHPLLVMFALVGNDVCNHYNDTEAHMTTNQQMHDNLLKTLTFLDSRVPAGSHVLIVGLADGRYLYEYLQDRYHPFGEYNQDVTYPKFYEYLKCLQVTPCAGWMTANGTLRNYTSERAMELSKVQANLAEKYKHSFKNYEVNFMPCPIEQVIEDWEKVNGKGTAWQLIEPVDGFHPNQYAQALIADYVWDYLEKHLPHYLGDVNPNNHRIHSIFGDQGGY